MQLNQCQPAPPVKKWRRSLKQFYCPHVPAEGN